MALKSALLEIGFLLISRMTVPLGMPISSAKEPGRTLVTLTPP